MIGILQGTVRHGCVLTAAGIGYKLELVTPLEEGSAVELLVESHGRDADVKLYGFATPEEAQTFRALLKAPGVGPAAAMAVLRCLGVSGLVTAITAGDQTAIAAARGVGKKAAAAIATGVPVASLPAVPVTATDPGPTPAGPASVPAELVETLVALGVPAGAARSLLDAVLTELGGPDPATLDEADVLATALARFAGTPATQERR